MTGSAAERASAGPNEGITAVAGRARDDSGRPGRTSGSAQLSIARDIASVSADWEWLARRVQAPPFSHPGWFAAWWSAFGSGRLEIVCLRRDGELVGLLPLAREAHVRLCSPTNWHTPSFAPLAIDPATERELLDVAFSLPALSIELDFVDGDSEAIERARDAARSGRRELLTSARLRSPYVALEGTWDDYERGLSRSRRKALRRGWTRLEREGRVDIEIVDGSEALDIRLAEAFAVESSGWKGDMGTAMASRPDTRQFYTDIAHWGAQQDVLRLAFLRLDGCAIAFDYALQQHGVWYSLKAGYDDGFRPFGPGALLLRGELERAFDDGLTRFDLLGDEDPFKLSWTDASVERMRLRAFASTTAGRLARTIVQLDERVRPAMRAVRARVAR